MYFTFHDFMAHKTSNILYFIITHHDGTHSPYMLNDLHYDEGEMELSTQQTTGSVESSSMDMPEQMRSMATLPCVDMLLFSISVCLIEHV